MRYPDWMNESTGPSVWAYSELECVCVWGGNCTLPWLLRPQQVSSVPPTPTPLPIGAPHIAFLQSWEKKTKPSCTKAKLVDCNLVPL